MIINQDEHYMQGTGYIAVLNTIDIETCKIAGGIVNTKVLRLISLKTKALQENPSSLTHYTPYPMKK